MTSVAILGHILATVDLTLSSFIFTTLTLHASYTLLYLSPFSRTFCPLLVLGKLMRKDKPYNFLSRCTFEQVFQQHRFYIADCHHSYQPVIYCSCIIIPLKTRSCIPSLSSLSLLSSASYGPPFPLGTTKGLSSLQHLDKLV